MLLEVSEQLGRIIKVLLAELIVALPVNLKEQGFRTCLWQLPYFTPKNRYFKELVENGMAVKSPKGGLPLEDAVLDFSNPKTVAWYQSKLEGLLKQGVAVIKADFGEAAPYLNGMYASGKTGLYEHNLYPVRYNKAAYDIIKKTNNGEGIIWGRSAWAGSQRFPLHWGGDAATTNTGLLGSIREGLSFGLSGFSFQQIILPLLPCNLVLSQLLHLDLFLLHPINH